MAGETFYATTPIYYVNDVPHIGHAYTTVATDCISRYKRLKGYDVLFLTGTDEHGQKVEESAKAAGSEAIELADRVVKRFQALWEKLEISNDDFIRTTEPRHKKAVEHIWKAAQKNGDIYLGHYEDWYCTPCENFLTVSQLVDGKCPDCTREVEKLKEPSYFFRLSKYGEPLLKHIEQNPDFIRPENRRNEAVSFIKEGLRDLSVSRTTFSWGIPVPDDPDHIIYVWFDALTNYLAGAGYPGDAPHWPADVHMIGKDILRFHSVYWPAFLMSAGVELPKSIFAHGWWTVEGRKMSKSLGNVVDPAEVADKYGTDQFRYFLLREVPFGLDGDFSIKALIGRINGDLANDLGNLLNRTLGMLGKYTDGAVPEPVESKQREQERALRQRFESLPESFDRFMDKLQFHQALSELWAVIRDMNRYVDAAAPWKEQDPEVRGNVLHTLTEGLRIVAVYVFAFMPSSAEKIWEQLGMERGIEGVDFDLETSWGTRTAGLKFNKADPIFPKVEIEAEA